MVPWELGLIAPIPTPFRGTGQVAETYRERLLEPRRNPTENLPPERCRKRVRLRAVSGSGISSESSRGTMPETALEADESPTGTLSQGHSYPIAVL